MARTPSHSDKGPANFGIQVTAAAGATPAAPNPSLGHVIDYTLTVNATIAKPVYDSVDAGPFAGEELTFILRQSGAGSFTVTWATGYKAVGFAATSGSATAVDVVTFVFDGTTWNIASFVKGGTA
jgi:hypothetical protein